MKNVFQPGDVIKGLPPSNQHYGLTNENMTLGVVTQVGTLESAEMTVMVVTNTRHSSCEGEAFSVMNDDDLFVRIGRLTEQPQNPSYYHDPKWVKSHIDFSVPPAVPILF